MNNLSKTALAITLVLGLSACNNSNSTDKTVTPPPPPVNTAPVIKLTNSSVTEKQTITLTADVTDNGTVSSYAWQQTSGTSVEITGSDTNSISFTAPSVTADETLAFSLEATDNEGLSSTSTVNVTIEQALIKLTLAGVITDSPIVDATITVKIGDNEQTFTADNNGNYNAELMIDDDQYSDFISVTAQGKNEQQQAKLSSLLGSVNSLTQLAGDDNILTSDEKFSVNVTNISTAKSALMLRENSGENITTDTDLSRFATAINGDKMLALATALKVAIDKSATNSDLALPEGINNTLELALNAQASQEYITLVADTPEYSDARDEIMADSNLVDTNLAELASEYFFIKRHIYESIALKESDHTGTLFVDIGAFTFTWQLTEGVLSLDFGDTPPALYTGQEQVEVNGQQQNSQFDYILESLSFTQVSNELGVVTFEEKTNIRKHYLDVDIADGFEHNTSIQQAISADAISDFNLANNADTKYSLPIPYNFFSLEDVDQSSLAAGTFEFTRDGNGHLNELNRDFTWQLAPKPSNINKNELIITFADNTKITYTQLTSSTAAQYYAVVVENEAKKMALSGYIGGEISATDKFSTPDIPGIYVNELGSDPLSNYWWELWPTGQAYTVSTVDRNNDGQITADEVYVAHGDWTVTETNQLNIRRRRDPSRGYPYGCFFEENNACFLFNDRYWQLFGQDNNHLYLTNYHNYDIEGDGIFDVRYISNRTISKATERPVSLPVVDGLPSIAPQKIANLLDPRQYIDKTLYAINHDGMPFTNDVISALSPILLKAVS